MPVVHAVYENGVFKPTEPVSLPEACEVEFEPRVVDPGRPTPPNQGGPTPMFISRPNPSPEELERLLDEMAAMGSGQVLPADWSRADIYDDHD